MTPFPNNRRTSYRRPRTALTRSSFFPTNTLSELNNEFSIFGLKTPIRKTRRREPFDTLFDVRELDDFMFNERLARRDRKLKKSNTYSGCQCENCNKENITPQNDRLETV